MFTFITIHSEIFGIRDSHLTLEGDLILTGDKIRIATGTSIMVYKDAKLTIGEDVTIGGNSKVFSQFKVTLEKGLRTAWEVQIIDTNFHFTKNLKTGVVHNAVGEIIVGEHSWIANRATLAKGTVLPPKTVVANNSYVNKTFNLGINQKSLVLAGMPAKVVGQDLVRLKLSGEEEKKIRDSFN